MTTATVDASTVWHARPSANNAKGGADAVLLDDGAVAAEYVTRHGNI